MTRQDPGDTPSGRLLTGSHLLSMGALCCLLIVGLPTFWCQHLVILSSVHLPPAAHLSIPHGVALQVQKHKSHGRNNE